tara:strand:- start:23959 stop:24552 length:594 start_codon:yes stop_codon:yes gene_type:complete
MVETVTHNGYTSLINIESQKAIKFSTYKCPSAHITFVPEILPGETTKIELKDDPFHGEVLGTDLIAGLPRVIKPPPVVYGFITCTLSSNDVIDPWLGLPGDGDCLDAVLIASESCIRGHPVSCCAIGAWMCNDNDESDWKIALVNLDNDLTTQEVEKAINEATEWLKTYKPNCLRVIKYIRDPIILSEIISHHQTTD